MTEPKIIATVLGTFIVGIFIGSYFFSAAQNGGDDHAAVESKPLYWVAPMDSNYRRDEPGLSPMGMELVPVYSDEGNSSEGVVIIAPEVVQNIGVRTSKVELGMLSRNIGTVGFVGVDEDLTSHIHVRSAGWIEDLRIKAEGEEVKKGDLLFRFYSPDIANAKSELVQAIRSNNSALISASKARLLALDVPLSQINRIVSKDKVDDLVEVYAPQDGIITKLNVAEGMHIGPGTTILSLADLASVWINAEVFEDEAPWLKSGAKATVQVPFLPERKWLGIVNYVYPIVDPKTRTIRARLVLDNADFALKPNMYANVEIEAEIFHHTMKIPREALIRTGSSNRVIEAMGGGHFRPVAVTVGIESGNYVQILTGLTEGMEIVTSGQFLIDSEASLNSGFGRMQGSSNQDIPADEPQAVDHSQMDHSQMGHSQMDRSSEHANHAGDGK
jgi:Cu(I)/Ag(I) efflux system membrane fusion protein